MTDIRVRHHIHIDTRIECELASVLVILSITVIHHLTDRSPVTYNEALEAPLAAQNIIYEESVTCRRDTVIVIE